MVTDLIHIEPTILNIYGDMDIIVFVWFLKIPSTKFEHMFSVLMLNWPLFISVTILSWHCSIIIVTPNFFFIKSCLDAK
jgi:hypothetical protein